MKLLPLLLFLMLTIASSAQRPGPDPKLSEMLSQKDETVLQDKIKQLTNSSNEDDLLLLISYYNAKRDPEKSKLTGELVKQRFPNGKTAFNELTEVIYNERDPDQNEKNYRELVERFGSQPQFVNKLDNSRYFVAVSFLGKKRPAKVLEYLNLIQESGYKSKAFSYAARESIAAQDYVLGESLIRKSFADLKGDTTGAGYDEYCRIFSELLYANGKYEEGWPYAKRIYDKQSQKTSAGLPKIKSTYLNYMVTLGHYTDAYPLMIAQLKSGSATPLVKEKFKMAYKTVNGSEEGFDVLFKDITEELRKKIKDEVVKKMINVPAFNFDLKDLKGKSVKLTDYKGKVVILDFWATWCAPCKASFPMMQEAVNHFKNEKDVVFLFIHTMETTATATKDAGAYIKDMKYTFNVLMDLKNPSTQNNPAAAGFKVNGIPTKIIIDKSGVIRFRTLGNVANGSDAFLEEMTAMIEVAQKS
jgi:thiol-disulfide isomerase/thioredoxin